jgi:hypothetical protein
VTALVWVIVLADLVSVTDLALTTVGIECGTVWPTGPGSFRLTVIATGTIAGTTGTMDTITITTAGITEVGTITITVIGRTTGGTGIR